VTLPPVVDAAWVAEHLGDGDLLLADVRGPNAHARGHVPGSIPLVVGAPGQFTDRDVLLAFATEASLRLRRHGVTGEERLVLYDGGDCVSAASALSVAELAGHPRVAVLAGGLAGWDGELATGAVDVEKSRVELQPRLEAVATREEVAATLGTPAEVVLLDIRREDEYTGRGGYQCDPRQGHIPGARRVENAELFAGPGQPRPAAEVQAVVGAPEGASIVTYCHSGSRSGLAVIALRAAGYRARNYLGSWHEWSRHPELPLER
jgi:thiosulfate/3-mercaptopyruvate sulfurtransferase